MARNSAKDRDNKGRESRMSKISRATVIESSMTVKKRQCPWFLVSNLLYIVLTIVALCFVLYPYVNLAFANWSDSTPAWKKGAQRVKDVRKFFDSMGKEEILSCKDRPREELTILRLETDESMKKLNSVEATRMLKKVRETVDQQTKKNCSETINMYLELTKLLIIHDLQKMRNTSETTLWANFNSMVLTLVAENYQKITAIQNLLLSLSSDKSPVSIKQLDEMLKKRSSAIRKQLNEMESLSRDLWISTVIAFVMLIFFYIFLFVKYGHKVQLTRSVLQEQAKRRAEALDAEKDQERNLLYEVLPRVIADQLIAGRIPEPKMYNCVTVYASDIVGFTVLSTKSTPMQVVELLNELFSETDKILHAHDCVKVETIGDAYIIASGLPVVNEPSHSDEICSLALDLMQLCSQFQIPHLEGETVMIRIGIHTGPIAAGVVGLKAPKFCMFGHTLNITSHMESSGAAMRIQISDKTANHLYRHHKKFKYKRRGTTDVKAKGKIGTYWLISKQGHAYVINLAEADKKYKAATYMKYETQSVRGSLASQAGDLMSLAGDLSSLVDAGEFGLANQQTVCVVADIHQE